LQNFGAPFIISNSNLRNIYFSGLRPFAKNF
jgi:hypothetical protein